MHQGSQTLESIAHDEGRFLAVQGQSGTEFIDTWHVRDYLGSVRAVYDITPEPEDVTSAGSQILEQNDYYAFGGRIDTPYQAYDQTNRYRYNGKEQLRFEGINLDPGLTDYGARYYAPTFGRWTSPDPLADKYYSVSPYAFCNNNPVNFVDPDGEVVGLAMDVISVGCGVYNLVKNIKAGNTKAAWGDAAGIGVDLVCAIVPGLTVGAGATRTIGKVAINVTEGAIDTAKAADTAKDAGKAVKNPYGSKGKPDHQDKIKELVDKAGSELITGEEVVTEEKIRVEGSNRRPDVQIIGKDGKTRKIFEAERNPNSKRNRLREEEYDRLGIEHETHSLN